MSTEFSQFVDHGSDLFVTDLFQRLPNLETLSRLNVGALGFGWLGLTVAIVAGAFLFLIVAGGLLIALLAAFGL